MDIFIKAPFSGWHKVTKDTALEYCKYCFKNIMTMNGQELVDYINKIKVKGINFNMKELSFK